MTDWKPILKGVAALLVLFGIGSASWPGIWDSPSAWAEVWSFERIQARAVEVSPLVRSLAKDAEAEQLRAEGAGLLPNPSTLIQTGKTRSGGYAGPIWDLTLNQTIPFPGKRGTLKRVQELEAEIAKVSQAEAKILIHHAALLAAVRVSVLNEISHHSEERRRRFRLIELYLRTHPQVSPTQKVENSLIENQMRLLEKGILDLSAELQDARADLAFLLQEKAQIEPQMKWLYEARLPNRDQILSQIWEKNFGLQRKSLEVQKAEQDIKKAELDPWPDFNLGVNYREENVFPANYFYSGTIGLVLPFFDHGQYSIPASRAKREAEEARLNLYRAQLENQLNRAWIQLEAAGKVISQFPLNLVRESEESFNRAEMGFRKGRINAATLLQADAQIHETMDSIYRVQQDYVEKLSHLFLLAGQPLQWERN